MLFFAKLLFSGLALWWGLHQVKFDHLCLVFQGLPLATYAAAYLMMCLCTSLNGLRLYCIAKKLGINQSFQSLHTLTWIGMFFNQLLPGGIGGDAYRIYTLAKSLPNGLQEYSATLLSSSAIIWDRILGIVCLGVISAPMLWLIHLPDAIKIMTTTIYGLLLGGIITLRLFIKYPIFQKYKLIATTWKLFATASALFQPPKANLMLTSITLALVNFVVFYLLVITLKIPLDFAESSVLFTLSLVVMMIPISISGWGLREGFLTAYFSSVGLPPEMGFTLGVLHGLLMLANGAIGAVFYLFAKKLKNSLANTRKIDSMNTM